MVGAFAHGAIFWVRDYDPEQNRDNVLDVLDEFINTVSRFRTLLIKNDFDTFEDLMRQANEIRRIIDH